MRRAMTVMLGLAATWVMGAQADVTVMAVRLTMGWFNPAYVLIQPPETRDAWWTGTTRGRCSWRPASARA